jgi:predicted HTH domain antitoxin
MIRITHRELSEILGVSLGYCHQLLHRRKIRLTNEYLGEIVNLIRTYVKQVKKEGNG